MSVAPSNSSKPQLPGICANCYAALPRRQPFCSQCGQSTPTHVPGAFEFVHELLTHYIALEGSLWRTLRRLFLSPGYLTLEWLNGRRTQYVPPLRLYLTASILFFLVLKFSTVIQISAIDPAALPDRPLGELGMRDVNLIDFGNTGFGQAIDQWLASTRERLSRRIATMTPTQAAAFLNDFYLSRASYTMFFLLPFYALLVKLAYRKRDIAFGAHVVFALHAHAFLFALLLLLALPWPGMLETLVLPLVPLYFLLAMQRVYGGRWTATLLRAAAIAVAYGIGFIVSMIGLTGSLVFAA